uniref:Reverse transcriptase domain-containing protein n=1 Tax=Cacopsylla melanoneura TaxID=428564 RepID=A0A8D9BKL9_9HEMI
MENTIYSNYLTKFMIPKEWLKSTFITLPKKSNAKKCSDYRTISLMSHALKIFLRIIHNRIYTKLEAHISNTQFGFRNSLGTREALFSIQVLIQKCRDVEHPVYLCFIDFEKSI